MKKKQILVVILAVAIIGVGIAVFKTNVSANSEYGYEVTRINDCDLVKDVDLSDLDEFLPILTGLGAHIHNEDVKYHPFQGNFYEVDLSYLLAYMKDAPLVEYTEDDNNYYLDSQNIEKLTDYAFCAGAYESIYDFSKKSEAYYDNETHMFVVRKRTFPMDYSIKLTKGQFSYGEKWKEDFGYYDLEAILYKGDEIVGTMKYQIEYEDETYSVVSAELIK